MDATQVNAMIHVDLHYTSPVFIANGKKFPYIITFIDNLSRFVIHYSLLEDKSAATAL